MNGNDAFEHVPLVLNPEAIGDPDQTPVVQLTPEFVTALKAAGLVCECGGMNGYHDETCDRVG